MDAKANYLTVREAAKWVSDEYGTAPTAAAIYGWMSKKNRDGIRLRYVKVGGIKKTTAEWIRDFFDQRTTLDMERGLKPGKADGE